MENSDRTIGRVLSVDNFRVFIKIDDEIRGAYKSGYLDIYEIARINSYLIIPVGPDRIVALITRVTMKEDIEFDKTSVSILLPTPSRYVSATMLGTIINERDKEFFKQGVYNYPSLDNPVWYVTRKDLDQIFDVKKDNQKIDYERDFYLPIGTSPAFTNYEVKICPDQFFVKHAAILGNTGSGKSCTLTSIFRSLFRFDFGKGQKLKNAHIIIFDTNGEYKDAFSSSKDRDISQKDKDELSLINAYYYGGENEVKVPYWYMNWNELKALVKPSEGSQAPVLNRAIGLAKNKIKSKEQLFIPGYMEEEVNQLLTSKTEDIKKRTWDAGKSWLYIEDNEIKKLGQAVSEYDCKLGNSIVKLSKGNCFNDEIKQIPIRKEIQDSYNDYRNRISIQEIFAEVNIDYPTYYEYQELCSVFIDKAISLEGGNSNKIQEYLSTLRLRMNSFLNDKRIALPLMLKNKEKIEDEVLPQFLAFILGDFNALYKVQTHEKNFIDEYNDRNAPSDKNRTCQISIIDVSQLPFDVLEVITALLGRLILEFVANFVPIERGKHPIAIVLEEAQNYIAEDSDSVSKRVFERIAREGRKYGISLIVSSQRPSELSKTVLSQCNSFIIHRLQNPDDQKYVREIVSSANADLLDQLPVIPQQHAIITGDCVKTPVQVRINTVNPTPNSHNPQFVEKWLSTDAKIPYEITCTRWLGNSNSSENNTLQEREEEKIT